MVTPGDFQELYKALIMLMTDTPLVSRLGQAAWQTVQEHYSADIVTEQYLELFHTCTGATNMPLEQAATETVDQHSHV